MSSSLTLYQKRFLRDVKVFNDTYSNRYVDGKDLMFPSSYDLFNMMTQNILVSTNIEKVDRCSPVKANCIIRTYQLLNFEYDVGEFYSCYGAISYTLHNGVWETFSGRKAHSIHYDRHFLQIGPLPDDSIRMVESNFVDFPVKIS